MQERLTRYRQKAYRETVKNIIPSDYIPFNSFQEAESSLYSFLKDPNRKGLLLLGDAFSGKTTLLHHFKEKLLKQKAETAFLPIACCVSQLDNLTALLREEFAQYNIVFSAGEMVTLKDYSFVFMIDNYEAQGYFPNVYIKGALAEWPKSKYIVSCCSSHLIHEEHYPLYFMPFHLEEPQPQKWVEIHLSPITPIEIDKYLQRYTKENLDPLKELLAKEPMLYDLFGNPFLLKQMRPLLSEDIEDIIDVQVICNHLMKGWFAEYSMKVQQQAEAKNEDFDATRLSHYSTALARCLEEQKNNPDHPLLSSLVPNSRKVWFDHSLAEFFWGWRASPIVVNPRSHHCQFIGNSLLQKYFSSLPVASFEAQSTTLENIEEMDQQQPSLNYSRLLYISLMNQKLYTEDGNKLGLMADSILRGDKYSKHFRKQLFSFVKASRNDAGFAVLAANAITVLNSAKVSFSRKDLDNIKIPFANLSYGIFDGTSLKCSNLENVKFNFAWLQEANFSFSNMKNVSFGEQPYFKLPADVKTCCYALNGKKIIGAAGNSLYIYDLKKDIQPSVLRGHTEFITTMVLSESGQWIVSGGYDKTIRLWSMALEECKHTLKVNEAISCLIISKDEKKIIWSGGDRGNIFQVEIETLKPISTLIKHTKKLLSLALSHNGKYFISGGEDQIACVWLMRTSECKYEWETSSTINCAAFNITNNLVAVGCDNETIFLWSLEAGDLIHKIYRTGFVISLAFSLNNQWIVAGGSIDQSIHVISIATGKSDYIFEGHDGWVRSVNISPDEKYILSGSDDGTIRQWNLVPKELYHKNYNDLGHTSWITSIAADKSGKLVISASIDNTLRLWDTKTGRCLRHWESTRHHINCLAFDPSGQWVVAGYPNGVIKIYSIINNEEKTLKEQSPLYIDDNVEEIKCVAVSSDGHYIAAGGVDKKLYMWRLSTRQIKQIFKENSTVTSVAFSQDNQHMAVGYEDGCIQLRLLESGEILNILKLKEGVGWVDSIYFSYDGKYLISGQENVVRLWLVKTGECEYSWTMGNMDECVVKSIAMSPDDRWIVVGSYIESIQLINMKSKKVVDNLFVGDISTLVWVNNTDKFFITGGNDKTVKCWKIINTLEGTQMVLCWSTGLTKLVALNTCIDNVIGLKEKEYNLLIQRKALPRQDQVQMPDQALNIVPSSSGLLVKNEALQETVKTITATGTSISPVYGSPISQNILSPSSNIYPIAITTTTTVIKMATVDTNNILGIK